MIKIKQNKNGSALSLSNGFTLIEVLIYSALVMFVIGVGTAGAFYLISGSERDNARTNTITEAEFLMRKIDQVLTGADSINVPAPGSSASTLSITKSTEVQNPVVINLSGTQAQIAKGVGTPQFLTGERVKITNLNFEHLAPDAGKPAAIKTTFTADGQNFEILRYLRK